MALRVQHVCLRKEQAPDCSVFAPGPVEGDGEVELLSRSARDGARAHAGGKGSVQGRDTGRFMSCGRTCSMPPAPRLVRTAEVRGHRTAAGYFEGPKAVK